MVKAEDKGIECEICKGWSHTGCVDLTDNEYEMLASHKLSTIHWYCTTCNIKSVELLHLVFGLQDRIQKTESEIENMKRETSAKFSTIECTYEAVNEDLKILSQKIEGVKKCCEDSDKLIRTVQEETRNEIENIKKGMENKISKEDMEKALNQHTEMLADETYASKMKNEVDQHLNGMDSQISRVNTRIDEVRKKAS